MFDPLLTPTEAPPAEQLELFPAVTPHAPRRIRPVYLLDAIAEAALAVVWLTNQRRLP